jgi:DNA-binding YbaB/EbfC family protein
MDFDLGNIGALLGGMQQRVADMKANQTRIRCEGTAGDGMVKITLTGDFQVADVHIAPAAMDDRELLEDLVRAALAESLRNVQGELAKGMQDLTGGLPIPPGLLPF